MKKTISRGCVIAMVLLAPMAPMVFAGEAFSYQPDLPLLNRPQNEAPQLVATPALPGATLPSSNRRILKKKLLVTGFETGKSAGMDDLESRIAISLAQELAFKLQNGGQFVTAFTPDYLPRDVRLDEVAADRLIRVAEFHARQFVVTGKILNAERESEKRFFGFAAVEKRRLELEISVYEGVSGALLSRRMHSSYIEGKAEVGRDKPVGSAAFRSTPFGASADKLLDQVAAGITQDLASQAFTARVLQANDGKIMIDAGSLSGLASGDVLQIRAQQSLPVRALAQSTAYGVPVAANGSVMVEQVQAQFAIARLNQGALQVGDWLELSVTGPGM